MSQIRQEQAWEFYFCTHTTRHWFGQALCKYPERTKVYKDLVLLCNANWGKDVVEYGYRLIK